MVDFRSDSESKTWLNQGNLNLSRMYKQGNPERAIASMCRDCFCSARPAEPETIDRMTIAERAYLAGLVDGEGTVTLTCPQKGQYPQPQVSISNNSLELILWVKSKLGFGSVLAKKPKKPHHSVSYAWQANRIGQCTKILDLVYPFLILKREQARIVLEQYPVVTMRNGKYTEIMFKQKQDLVKRIQLLNQRPKPTVYNTPGATDLNKVGG